MEIINYGQTLLDYPVGRSIRAANQMIDHVSSHVREIVGTKEVVIWCRGSSGAMLAALLGTKLQGEVRINHIKKDGELAHSSNTNPYADSASINIVIDDFVASGETLNAIWSDMLKRGIRYVDILIVERGYDANVNFVPRVLITGYMASERRDKMQSLVSTVTVN